MSHAATDIKPLDVLAVKITNKVGSMGFFLSLFIWTVLWTGFNVAARAFPHLHWKQFDPFPDLVIYSLIGNVLQLLLLPLVLVGQNVEARQADKRAELDFQTNQAAEKEIAAVMREVRRVAGIICKIAERLELEIDSEEQRAIDAEAELGEKISSALVNKWETGN